MTVLCAKAGNIYAKFGYTTDKGDGCVASSNQHSAPLTARLDDNLNCVRDRFGISADLIIRRLTVDGRSAAVLSVEGMVDRHLMADGVILPLSRIHQGMSAPELMEHVRDHVLGFTDMLQTDTVDELIELMMSGFGAVLIDGVPYAVLGGLQAFMIRGISEPSTEMTMRGSREGFTEAIRINISMIRRRMKTPDLIFEMMSAGKSSRTAVCLCYRRDRVSPQLLQSVRSRIEQLPLDTVLESGYVQPFLESKGRSLFSEVGITERPDTLCGKIEEGRIGVLVDGTPFVLVVPTLFVENFQSMDDYAVHPAFASFLRIIKYIAFAISILLPSIYVSIGTFHPEMLPTHFLSTIIEAERTTPFSLMSEALLIHFLFEIMREAGLRFPKALGHAVSIVGALVIGDAAVGAGLIGAPMVIVVGLTAISSFVIPALYGPMALLRFGFIVLGGWLGLYGVVLGVCVLISSICSLNIQTIPYTAPLTPFQRHALKDVLIRSDWRNLWNRSFRVQNMVGSHIADQKERKGE